MCFSLLCFITFVTNSHSTLWHPFWSSALFLSAFQQVVTTSKQTKVPFYIISTCFKNTHPLCLDNVLVAVAYYIGSEKEVNGALPFSILGFVTTACLICSEIIARTRKRKISLTGVKSVNQNRSRNLVISNLIPFTKLNIIFAFGCLIMALIKVIQRTQIGIPNLSIQIVSMLLCLLFSNSEAKNHFKRRSVVFRWLDLFMNKLSRTPIDAVTKVNQPQVTDQVMINIPNSLNSIPTSKVQLSNIETPVNIITQQDQSQVMLITPKLISSSPTSSNYFISRQTYANKNYPTRLLPNTAIHQ